MSRTAVSVDRRDTFVPAGAPESTGFNWELLAVMVTCAAFWALVALTVYWLI